MISIILRSEPSESQKIGYPFISLPNGRLHMVRTKNESHELHSHQVYKFGYEFPSLEDCVPGRDARLALHIGMAWHQYRGKSDVHPTITHVSMHTYPTICRKLRTTSWPKTLDSFIENRQLYHIMLGRFN